MCKGTCPRPLCHVQLPTLWADAQPPCPTYLPITVVPSRLRRWFSIHNQAELPTFTGNEQAHGFHHWAMFTSRLLYVERVTRLPAAKHLFYPNTHCLVARNMLLLKPRAECRKVAEDSLRRYIYSVSRINASDERDIFSRRRTLHGSCRSPS